MPVECTMLYSGQICSHNPSGLIVILPLAFHSIIESLYAQSRELNQAVVYRGQVQLIPMFMFR